MATKPTRFAQMGDTTEKVKVYTGIPKQLVVDTSKWKIHLMDGSTPGGFEVAMVADLTAGLAQKVDRSTYTAGLAQKVDRSTYTAGLAQKVDTSEFETALKELIVEFGGQVPA
ncbi:hypothetical protein [Sutterella wadsworthensis]|uniref:hypothetical protein n=1 Tax=Sutterella wadsworthensis TaxID=40545 RepID=UPI00307D29BD